jgi:bifunctional DNA-binding transcriptional regulator/antitoxin component of YhaV-PrlF toxin-antitoxin module
MKATIDAEGRVPLGLELQSALGLRPGDEVAFENHGGEWVIKAARSDVGLCWEGNVLVHRGACTAPPDTSLSQFREARLGQLAEGLTR